MKLILFLFTVLAFVCCTVYPPLKTYNADISQTSVSGISAGGFMAVQFQVAYSKNIVGSGIIAGGPYFCAEGQIYNALGRCMAKPKGINLSKLKSKMIQFENKKYIDSLSNLVNQKVYLFSGTKDSVVKHGVMEHLRDQFEGLGVEDIETNFETEAQHAWITNDYGNKCNYKGDPFINNCHENVPLDLLQHIYGEDNIEFDEDVKAKSENLLTFSQKSYTQKQDSLNDHGYIYVPTACQKGEKCRVHISFHGCLQTTKDIGTKFVEHSGLNGIAEQNNIIVLYPQAKKSSYMPSNPNGCFDWWGYTQSGLPGLSNYKYATKQGSQMTSVWNMLNDVTGHGQNYGFFDKISHQQTVEWEYK